MGLKNGWEDNYTNYKNELHELIKLNIIFIMNKKYDLVFWKKCSNIGALFCFLILVILVFFENGIKNSFLAVFILGIVAVTFFLTAEIMKFIIKSRNKK